MAEVKEEKSGTRLLRNDSGHVFQLGKSAGGKHDIWGTGESREFPEPQASSLAGYTGVVDVEKESKKGAELKATLESLRALVEKLQKENAELKAQLAGEPEEEEQEESKKGKGKK